MTDLGFKMAAHLMFSRPLHMCTRRTYENLLVSIRGLGTIFINLQFHLSPPNLDSKSDLQKIWETQKYRDIILFSINYSLVAL